MSAFDDLGLLRSFVAIVEAGSISAGARRMKVPQPTLSRSLQALEERAGAALLLRDTHRMSLTPTGRIFLDEAQAILLLADGAQQRIREDQTMLSGHLRIFATIDLGQSVVTRLTSEFLLAHPQVTAALSLTNRPLQMIEEGCDVGVVPGKITDESVIARPAGTISLQLVAAPSLVNGMPAAKKPADLKEWPWIGLAGSHFWSTSAISLFGRGGAEQVLKVTPVLVSEGVTSMREAARTGLGLSIQPDWLVEEDITAGRLVRVLPGWRPQALPVHVVYAGHRLLPTRARSFVDFAVDFLKQALPVGR
ncbi:LysR family transcriptional regulator [Luteolibacter flavescens]|uniref:LysR family transcriptional regulator n=1 Tax=Luteolibacter flavescens TaxID=1859460 RepID=A0ABT3FU76_9BACT|nr:LysR family transcriptional regulator [Luteolibacter flavescens]MCW1886540.1 LysR family transcriptional regulator [Luteolibacter flavescens]